MASKQRMKTNKLAPRSGRAVNSPSSSTTSSSKQYPETSVDGQSSPASSSARSKPQFEALPIETKRLKENVTVTVRFRPLSPREIRQGEEIAWYADGETIVRNEHNPSIAYAYDRVFGPTTTTRHVYDVAAQHVVSGAMEGVNGTIFAYGVTSSGKTHTMHGDQRSPGIIPLAVKDAFSIIQETPNQEFLLRLSYLEIYNEVVNDLLNPAGQNLRIREDAQGTYVEGVTEEVVLSPAHALSLIAAGEEHRHVGSTNFNLQSSRSHTIFTLTIESSPCGENCEGEAVTLSQLNLIDLAGSESSKVETTGVRRKEGSYINKSLLTLGTVISKLTDVRAAHIPYRDSKLTRLLQSSLSGHGRVSLICTVTPSSSNTEETHNTLKFAHRSKHIEIRTAQNKIIDEKSLIKKYQNEIRRLKEELEQLKRGIVPTPKIKDSGDDNLVVIKHKVEDGQNKLLQSRLEQKEDAKAALLSRIQRLTKLILVSTKDSPSARFSHRTGLRRRHSFGEEELAYLPYKRRDLILDDENIDVFVSLEGNIETIEDIHKEEKKSKKHGLLNWLKPKKRDGSLGTAVTSSDKSSGVKSVSTPSTPQGEKSNFQTDSRRIHSQVTESSPSAELFTEAREDSDVREENFLGQETPLVSYLLAFLQESVEDYIQLLEDDAVFNLNPYWQYKSSLKSIDQVELLREQQKILSGELALQTSALKRLMEVAVRNPQEEEIQMDMSKLNDDIKMKSDQIASLEKQIRISSLKKMDQDEAAQTIADLVEQLNEKAFELEVKTADNRIIQEQLNQKINECIELQKTVISLKQELSDALELNNFNPESSFSNPFSATKTEVSAATSEGLILQEQENEIKELKQKLMDLTESNHHLEARNHKLAEDSSYAKGLASAAAVELKALSEEVAKLMNQNEKLNAELAASKTSPSSVRRVSSTLRNGRRESMEHKHGNKRQDPPAVDLKRELAVIREREMAYEAALAEREQRESELQKRVEESKQREAYLENELANMWVQVAKLKKHQHAAAGTDVSERSEFD